MEIDPLIKYIIRYVELTSQDIVILSQHVKIRNYLKGQYIVQQGDVCKHESFVLSGCAKTSFIDKEGDATRQHLCQSNQEDIISYFYIKRKMTKEALLNKALKTISQLPQNKIKEVNDFADFILKKHDEEVMQKGIEKLVSDSKSFDFLKDEEGLYSLEDLKERFK